MHKGQRIVSKWAMIAFYCGCRFLHFSPFKPLDIFQIVRFVSRLITWTELCIHNGSDTAGWYYYEICQKKSEGCDHRNHRLSMLWNLMWPQVCGLLTRHVHSGPSAISLLSSFKNKCLNGLYFWAYLSFLSFFFLFLLSSFFSFFFLSFFFFLLSFFLSFFLFLSFLSFFSFFFLSFFLYRIYTNAGLNTTQCWVNIGQNTLLGKNNPIAGFVRILQCAGLF